MLVMGNSGSRLVGAILVAGILLGAFLLVVWPSSPGTPPGGGDVAAAAGPRSEVAAAKLLRAWDARRAEAWAASDAAALAALYTEGSKAGRADVAMLASWTERGLAVDELTTQLLAVDVVEDEPGHLLLRVRDRISAAVATGEGVSEPLPAGAIEDRDLELRRVGGGWLVASVRPVPQAVRR